MQHMWRSKLLPTSNLSAHLQSRGEVLPAGADFGQVVLARFRFPDETILDPAIPGFALNDIQHGSIGGNLCK
jgi:hypothetical protein